ncbi:GxxExxY protein [Flavobacterium silvaticum]|uniref:GxxExxY protein n=1 Tax=Flavobacterium silvaticum TaxID=1852020 RepID=UPI00293BED9F|nr:GxxExxY protein [Flavobacterium silvaticum]
MHRSLGPGLLEKVYEVCLTHEIRKVGLNVQQQVKLPIVYDNMVFKEYLRLDLLVEDEIIVEIKSVEILHPVCRAQMISQLKLSGKNLGFLINFNVPLIKNGIQRIVN